MAKSPTALFDTLLKKAKLSNKVSQTALQQASDQWHTYKKRPTSLRNWHDLANVLSKLDIVLNQVAWGDTRIEPLQWHSFCELHTTIATSLRTKTPLEPHQSGKSANDNTLATALGNALAKGEKRTQSANSLQAVA